MNMKKYIISIIFAFLFMVNNILAQKISNVRASSEGNQVKISYDFESSDVNQKYRVELFSSLDNFVTPLNSCTGSIGDTIVAGNRKTIVWSSNRAGLNYSGMVSFEVRAQKFMPLKFTNTFNNSYTMGKKLTVTYSGYKPSPQAYFVLYNQKDSIRITNAPSPTNQSVVVLPKVSAGNYNLKLVNPLDKQTAISTEFIVKKNKHLLIKIGIPVAILVGAGAYFYIHEKTNNTSNPTLDDLPKPSNPQ